MVLNYDAKVGGSSPLNLNINLQVLSLLCAVAEYNEMPVRHNEDKLNLTLSNAVRYNIDKKTVDDPHTKTNLLLQVSTLLRISSPKNSLPNDNEPFDRGINPNW